MKNTDGPAQLAQQLIRRELEIAGAHRRAGKQVPELPGLLRAGRAVRLPLAGMSASVGLARPTVYSLLASAQPTALPGELAATVYLCYLGCNGVSDARSVSEALKLDEHDVLDDLRRMSGRGWLSEGAVGYGSDLLPVFSLALNGQAALVDRAEVLQHQRVEGFSIYYEVPEEEVAKIERAAARLLSEDGHALIGAHVCSAMRMPELAVTIFADDGRDAFQIARELWAEIRRRARLPAAPPSISLVLEPRL